MTPRGVRPDWSGAGRASWTERAPISLEQRWDLDCLPQLWVSRAGDDHPVMGPPGTISRLRSLVPDAGGGEGAPEPRSLQAQLPCCGGFLSVSLPTQGTVQLVTLWLSLLQAPPANWTTRVQCGHDAECQAPWPDESLWLADHEPLCTALLWASGSVCIVHMADSSQWLLVA